MSPLRLSCPVLSALFSFVGSLLLLLGIPDRYRFILVSVLLIDTDCISASGYLEPLHNSQP
jgi:hypothetical protein